MMSMTGFAALESGDATQTRSWDVRSVNARGFDLRMRLPDRPEGLEGALRAKIAKVVSRGNVSLTLKTSAHRGTDAIRLDKDALAAALSTLREVEAAAAAAGVTLAPTTAAAVLSLRGVQDGAGEAVAGPSVADLAGEIDTLLAAFVEMRAREGAALAQVIGAQIDKIAELTEAAVALADARAQHMAVTYRAALDRLKEAADGMDPARVAQDIAALTVKADVTEEIDRLRAHVAAARALLQADGPVGRKLDFLTQEFNREANTLCSKAQMTELTRIGLDLKTVIDQLREQVQNVE